MCGIYGILDKSYMGLSEGDLGLFSQMGTVTELRGRHSSGAFAVSKELKPSPLVKVVGPSVNMLFDKAWGKYKEAFINGRAAIGHGRLATIGKVEKKNAHPFREGRYTLVHNGTIREGLDLVEAKVDVDSHALVKLIDEKGLKEAIESLKGAWAIALHDHEKNVVQFLRNYERDLCFAENNNAVYIMSEGDALEYLVKRNKLFGKVENFKANTLYTFDLEKKVLIEGEKIEGNIYPKTNYQNNHYTNNGGKAYANGGSRYVVPESQKSAAELVWDSLPRDYEIGHQVAFEVKSKLAIGNQMHFDCEDKKGNKVKFTTGNWDAASRIRTGDMGIGTVVSLSLEYQRKAVTYTVRFREVQWDSYTGGRAVSEITEGAKATGDSPRVITYGGYELSKEDWERLCNQQQCWACQGRLDPHDPDFTVVISQGGTLKPYCPDCVTDYRSTHGMLTTSDKLNIAQALGRYE